MKQAIDKIVAPLLASQKNIGLAVGVIECDQSAVFGFGMLSKTCSKPVDGNTLFEIGSVTKVFTSMLLASAVEDGLVSFNDRVCDLLPEFSALPREITLLRLATHTSGLPRLPSNFMQFIFKNPDNPYAVYSTADLLAYLSTYKPKQKGKSASTKAIRYSNLGFGLLGYILAQKLDISYEEALISRIGNKLGMLDTRVMLTPEQCERFATPHSPRGKPTSNWDLPAFTGAGALRSTTYDMLKFVAANLRSSETSLENMMNKCHVMHVEVPPPPRNIRSLILGRLNSLRLSSKEQPLGVALGWFISRLGTSEYKVYWHNGATGGYRAFTGFVKESNTGVVVLSNRGLGEYDFLFPARSIDKIGFNLLKFLNGIHPIWGKSSEAAISRHVTSESLATEGLQK
jgi:CubicO group peptidase (beta-lactamase class C family)